MGIDLKALGEFAAGFLVNKQSPEYIILEDYPYGAIPSTPHFYFENNRTAPILAHLAKRELIKQRFQMKYKYEEGRHKWYLWREDKYGEGFSFQSDEEALWQAIESAVK